MAYPTDFTPNGRHDSVGPEERAVLELIRGLDIRVLTMAY